MTETRLALYSSFVVVPLGVVTWLFLDYTKAIMATLVLCAIVYSVNFHLRIIKIRQKDAPVGDEEYDALVTEVEARESDIRDLEVQRDRLIDFTSVMCFEVAELNESLFRLHKKIENTSVDSLDIGIDLENLCNDIVSMFETHKKSKSISATLFLNVGDSSSKVTPQCIARDTKSWEDYYKDGSPVAEVTYPLHENSDFDHLCGPNGRIFQKGASKQILRRAYFLSDKLSSEKNYRDSNCKYLYDQYFYHYAAMTVEDAQTNWELPYVSLLTVPILSFKNGDRIVHGFLALDSLEENFFEEIYDVKLAQNTCSKLSILLESLRSRQKST